MPIDKHARQQIREELVPVLTGLPTTANRVFAGRPYPLSEGEIPGLFIVSPDERSEVSSIGAVKLDRAVNVIVIGYAKASSNAIENDLDRMAMEVEQAIGAAVNNVASDLMALIKEMVLTRTEKNISFDAEKPSGDIRMTFETLYRTARAVPETAIP